MTKTVVYHWPAQDTAAISALQTVGAGGSMVLNGTLKQPTIAIVEFVGICRKVTLTSAANLSAGNFTITGTYLGKPQTETMPGPNANTVESAYLYDNVLSIVSVASTGANTVSAGSGSDGHTRLYYYDPQSSVCAVSAQVIRVAGTNGSYSFKSICQDLDDPDFSVSNGINTMYNMINQTGGNTLGAHGILPITGTGAGAPTYDIPVFGLIPIKFCWISISSNVGDTAAFSMYITQQGIK